MKSDLVIVEWGDAHSDSTWQDPEQVRADHTPSKCWSVGWVLKKNKVGIRLFATFSDNDDIAETTFIKHGMIQKIIVLRTARKARKGKAKRG